MTRRHRIAYVQWAEPFHLAVCRLEQGIVQWRNPICTQNAGGKTHKQALLGLLRAGKGSIWWGQFRGLGWKNG